MDPYGREPPANDPILAGGDLWRFVAALALLFGAVGIFAVAASA